MKATDAFLLLDAAGLTVRAQGGRLVVEPTTLLRHELRTLAWDHRAALLALARDAEDRAALVVKTARRHASEVQRLHPEDRS
ncbi:MAG: hypothetical protein KKC79_09350 [Gammaproteobacteria bacterium]|nr:hypothetical protein [Gammaproteobacteria bacterium]MBU1442801.1 hypothetical protein [Gammaproteobacteria bacterium]MBU2286946.1 hypothetical protein [Gammaproteobacteria bacterium]MBU2408839.1 hypothetical protein [Gammaproteobacteria bacterium]